jgi:hypothetical protein
MLTALGLSVWCVFIVKVLATKCGKIASAKELPQTSVAGIVADKIGAALVAIGVLWTFWLGLSTFGAFSMFRTTGIVDAVENGRAQVTFKLPHGYPAGYDFPESDGFLRLRPGQTVALLNQGKTTEIAFRTWVFTALGTANGALLVFGGLLAGGTAALKRGFLWPTRLAYSRRNAGAGSSRQPSLPDKLPNTAR